MYVKVLGNGCRHNHLTQLQVNLEVLAKKKCKQTAPPHASFITCTKDLLLLWYHIFPAQSTVKVISQRVKNVEENESQGKQKSCENCGLWTPSCQSLLQLRKHKMAQTTAHLHAVEVDAFLSLPYCDFCPHLVWTFWLWPSEATEENKSNSNQTNWNNVVRLELSTVM